MALNRYTVYDSRCFLKPRVHRKVCPLLRTAAHCISQANAYLRGLALPSVSAERLWFPMTVILKNAIALTNREDTQPLLKQEHWEAI